MRRRAIGFGSVRSLGRSSRARRAVVHVPLGRAAYGDVLRLQRDLQRRRSEGLVGDVVITVEHDPVFTVGRRGTYESLLVSRQRLDAEGIEIFDVERGGDITYHGPGQLVVYPILDLRGYGRDIHAYVARLEEAAIRTLASFGIAAERRTGMPGVWVDGRKIASIGVHVRRWVTIHGLALNVEIEKAHFGMIRPCGLQIETVSIADLLDRPVGVDDVSSRFLSGASALFGWSVRTGSRDEVEGD